MEKCSVGGDQSIIGMGKDRQSVVFEDWVQPKRIGRLKGRYREQAHSYSWIGDICKKLVGCQAAFAGKPRSYKS
ncbi:hypothetical protein CES87_26440 [Pseudomonas sp. ERMR1:02]|nr:hypothetical protein CES87_26440 [Pseudomonas sp. ERMR1:02]